MIDHPTARITVTWSDRKKRWDLEASGEDGARRGRWHWYLEGNTTVPVDSGTGYLLLRAVKEALEAQLL